MQQQNICLLRFYLIRYAILNLIYCSLKSKTTQKDGVKIFFFFFAGKDHSLKKKHKIMMMKNNLSNNINTSYQNLCLCFKIWKQKISHPQLRFSTHIKFAKTERHFLPVTKYCKKVFIYIKNPITFRGLLKIILTTMSNYIISLCSNKTGVCVNTRLYVR